jgi:hypothetical protein
MRCNAARPSLGLLGSLRQAWLTPSDAWWKNGDLTGENGDLVEFNGD